MIKKSTSKPLRRMGWNIVLDKRKFFKFPLPDGRVAEVKAMTREEAIKQITETLEVELEVAA